MGATYTTVKIRQKVACHPHCNCWRPSHETQVLVDYDRIKTWCDLRNEVAIRMQLPAMRVALYEDDREVPYERLIEPGHGPIHAQERQ